MKKDPDEHDSDLFKDCPCPLASLPACLPACSPAYLQHSEGLEPKSVTIQNLNFIGELKI